MSNAIVYDSRNRIRQESPVSYERRRAGQEQAMLYERKKARQRKRRRRVIRRRICLTALMLLALLFGGMQLKKLIFGGSSLAWNNLSSDVYPESLIELLERNPETHSYVMNYPTKKDSHPVIDLSDEVTKGEIPLFLQWDERWGYETYGDDMMGLTGCGPTCLSMVRCGLGGDTQWDPYAVAQMAQQQGFYESGAGSSWTLMSEGAEEIGLTVHTVAFDEEHIRQALESGQPIICAMGPGDFTTAGHFIVLTGVDRDGKIRVNDPNSNKKSEKTWEPEDLMAQIRNLWAYSYEE